MLYISHNLFFSFSALVCSSKLRSSGYCSGFAFESCDVTCMLGFCERIFLFSDPLGKCWIYAVTEQPLQIIIDDYHHLDMS